MSSPPQVRTTEIPGLLVLRMALHSDHRGWFTEAWNREALRAAGAPDFTPVQQNLSFNDRAGATRGFHAEPWDKYISVASGSALGAWVDLRSGESFGRLVTLRLEPGVAVFVPRGVANAYQTTTDATAYTYLVTDHWRADVAYPGVALDDPDLDVTWPIPLAQALVSDKDRTLPRLREVGPLPRRPEVLLLGSSGQLGQELRRLFPDCDTPTRSELDLADPESIAAWDFSPYTLVLNAAAMTAVDAAESDQGRRQAWAVNATGPAHLAQQAVAHGFTLVHYSTDYVFDGAEPTHAENEPIAPGGVYGQSKAAGELAVRVAPRHYVLRTSWVIGPGHNFVRTMQDLAQRGVCPQVVNDQHGRLSFAADLAAASAHLVARRAPFGVYHVTNRGRTLTWHEVAATVFAHAGRDPGDIVATTTEQWTAQRRAEGQPISPRPRHSRLSLEKLESTGFSMADHEVALAAYLDQREEES